MSTALPYDSRIFPLAPPEMSLRLYDLVNHALHHGQLKKGVNESLKAVQRDRADLVLIAADADPISVVLEVPTESEAKVVTYVFVPSKDMLGRACGLSSPVVCCTILADQKWPLRGTVANFKTEVEKLLI
ncbi:MAG: hypothetical protein MHM6MM_001164 [Cercozoa sp. M6MM]